MGVIGNFPHEKLKNIKYIRLKLVIAATPLENFVILPHIFLKRCIQRMEMLFQDVSLVSRIDVFVCAPDKDLLADPNAVLMALRHKEKIGGLDHDKKQLSKINGLKLQYLIVFLSGVESLDVVEALSALLQLNILRC